MPNETMLREKLDEALAKAHARIANLEAQLAAAKRDLEAATEANHSVRVCKNHTSEIADGEGCAICDVEEANERADKAESSLAAAREKIERLSGMDRLVQAKADVICTLESELAALRARDGGRVKRVEHQCGAVVFPLSGEIGTCVDCGRRWTRTERSAAVLAAAPKGGER